MEPESVLLTLGPLAITDTVVTTWGIMALLWLLAWLASRRLADSPGLWQTALEAVVATMEEAVLAVTPRFGKQILPFVASLWVFLVLANLCGLVPGLHSPTRDLSATGALALLVFLASHWYGIRLQGPRAYFRHYLAPSPILLPFHLISEVSRTLALAVRLFGNIMSLEMAALLILLVAGFLAPVPILMLHIVEALVQAYIFGMLALIYVAGGLESQQERQAREE
ncbi:F0F1 ATP synthase subunit A [Gallaecimonas kandeliae]|uniref:F0F1 ATP synthase subunit A n=1 Tax=Gallaecimonas kandeliae TaxID=3029055 RepID=UPI0026472DEC|nr:F0F1 ATP synthase subunit A [Gallaecimonas kandeliae]WKE64219.1 F0F1 ATP synthase subunit A [Gallaecimonas kandeliae]